MRLVGTILLVIVVLLSVTAGAAKIMLVPEEVAFFGSVGFSETGLILFGAVQVLAAGLIVVRKTRKPGAIIAALAFAVSSLLIFMNGQTVFGLVSLMPVLIAIVIAGGAGQPNDTPTSNDA